MQVNDPDDKAAAALRHQAQIAAAFRQEVEIREDPNCPPGMIFMFRPVDMVAVPLPEDWLDQWKDDSAEPLD